MTNDFITISSFKEYVDHAVLEKLDAWENVTLNLFENETSSRLGGASVLSSSPQQLVYDSSISGATIASSLSFSNDSWKTSMVDFKNAAFINTGVPTGIAPSSTSAAVKRFNSYISTRDDVELFENVVFDRSPELFEPYSTKLDSYYSPCYFIKLTNSRNEGLAFGGLDKTNYTIKITAFCNDEYDAISLGGVFRDMKSRNIQILNNTPLNEFNDLKTAPWNYKNEIISANASGSPVIEIQDVSFNFIKSDNLLNKLSNSFICLATFDVYVARYPRQ